MLNMRVFIKYWLPVLVWMAVIFSASSDRLSMEHSARLVDPIVDWLFPHLSKEALHAVVLVARKGAHLFEYAVLACLLWRTLHKPALEEPRTWSWPAAAVITGFVMLYAASDEFHQLFVPTRQGAVSDVLLDTTGAVLALLFLWSLGRWRQRC